MSLVLYDNEFVKMTHPPTKIEQRYEESLEQELDEHHAFLGRILLKLGKFSLALRMKIGIWYKRILLSNYFDVCSK